MMGPWAAGERHSLSEDRVFSLCQSCDNKVSIRISSHAGGGATPAAQLGTQNLFVFQKCFI